MAAVPGRQRDAAVHGVDQGARLPGYEPVGQFDHAHHALEGGLSGGGFADRPGSQRIGDADEDVFRLKRPGCGRRAAQYQVGRPEQQHLVLGAARLAFGRIDDDHGCPLAGTGRVLHGSELARDGKRGTSAAAQVDSLGHLDELLGGKARQPAEDQVVRGQVYPPEPVQAGGQAGLPDAERFRRGCQHHCIPGARGTLSPSMPYWTRP